VRFRLSPAADTTGVTGMSEIEVPPALVVQRFEAPKSGDGFKASGEFVFVDGGGQVFVVHDWKATNPWDENFPAPDDYWASWEPDELTISTRDIDPADFERWLLAELGDGAA
jgi:hypothetical protein